jgi:pyridoxal phosphate enzyme (YggS family)
MIGHLQRNKVKYIIDKVDLIHSLDSVRLAKELNKRAKKNDLVVDCLVQINVVNEDAKFGILKKEVEGFLEEIKDLNHIRVVGLMNMAPFYDDSENARSDFRQMKILFNKFKEQENAHYEMKYLSMGMTNDYVVAVEEGSNMVRIGSAIFGQRDYS